MTINRKWPVLGALLADLMTREWAGLVHVDTTGDALERLVRSAVRTVQAVRGNALFARIIELDPERLLPYLLERPGRSQSLVLTTVAARLRYCHDLGEQVKAGQASGAVRAGDPQLLARSIVLACHGFALSAQTMTRPGVSVAALGGELATMLEGYLRP